MYQNIGEMVLLFWRTLRAIPLAWQQRAKVFEQFHEIGNASLLMVTVLSFFIGGVLTLQTGPTMVERGLTNFVSGLVGISIARELAPIMMAVLVAGRIGSAMAAEIGSMRVYQEIDALRTMNINPIHYLVLPRLVAIAVALPMLVTFAILVGWLGGAVVAQATAQIGIPMQSFF
jgi:phospholipid/cholesterol/gamma-HCH transport system permease protein